MPLNKVTVSDNKDAVENTQRCFDMVIRLPNNPHFIVTVATDKEEISVWNIQQ